MRSLKIALSVVMMLALLPACTATVDGDGGFKIEPSTKVMKSGIQAFGTLASSGTFEMELAPAYTKLARLRFNAASLLDQDRITVEQAIRVQGAADTVRSGLDMARYYSEQGNLQSARYALDTANSKLNDIEGLMQ